MTSRSRPRARLRHRASSTSPPLPTRRGAWLFLGTFGELLSAEALLLRGAAVADEIGRPLREGQGPRQHGKGRISAVESSAGFVDEESIAAQGRHGNDALERANDVERDFEILVIRRMGSDGEPLPGQRADEGRMQHGIVGRVGDAQVAAGKLAARERIVRQPRAPLAGRAPALRRESGCDDDPHRRSHRSSASFLRMPSSSRGVRKRSSTRSATSWPRPWPALRSNRKCCPAKIRLRVASWAAAANDSNERSVPGITSEVTLNLKGSVPSTSVSTAAAAALMTACAPGYEGSGAVLPTSGSQSGSTSVVGLPSVSAARIAVTGGRKS